MRNMPSSSPDIAPEARELVAAWGRKLREIRNRLNLSARDTAEAAGISRVTLHRIERGNPSVTAGSYAAVEATLRCHAATKGDPTDGHASQTVRVSQFPQLRRLAWNLADDATLSPEEPLSVYERNWRHLDQDVLGVEESAFIDSLVRSVGRGTLLV